MSRIQQFIRQHPDLFVYQASPETLLHDRLLARTVLRLLPPSVTPNRITLFRVLITPIVFLLVLFDRYHIGIAAFLLAAVTDMLDGSLARTRNQITNFGKLFDPLADKLLIGSMVLILVFRNFPLWLGVATLGIEVVFIIAASIAKYQFKTVRAANMWGKIKMILQVLAVFLTLAGLVFQAPYLLSIAAWVFGLALGFAFASLFAHGV
jgi:CDP-diacylglycerol--glycerol-3-phosphate 3-phosphatidyltransferase